MSKVANMLNMIKILEDNKVHSLQELSEKLEVTKRMIRVYKTELEQAGIYISTVKGVYGGYMLDIASNHIGVGLTEKDIKMIDEVNLYLVDKKDFRFKNEYYNISKKIIDSYSKNIEKTNKLKLESVKEKDESLRKIYVDIRNAITNRNKVYIEFFSVNSGDTERIIHPAELFSYYEDWYVAAFCEKRNEIRLFKLKDIQKYKILDEKYDESFKIKK